MEMRHLGDAVVLSWLRRSGSESHVPVPQPSPEDRIYAVGDVHGRFDLLARMLKLIAEDAQTRSDGREPVLVLLGDLVDRGDQTRETLDLMIRTAEIWRSATCLLGNHEAALLRFLDDPVGGASWLDFGGRQTCASYGVPLRNARLSPEELHVASRALGRAMGAHRDFLQGLKRMHQSGSVVLSHTGIDPNLPLDEQTEASLLWGRSSFLEKGPPPGLRVVHGHWAAPEPVVTPQRICVDTGAYYTSRLTTVRLDDETAILTVDRSGD